jgi:hypothetical protein
MPNVKLFSGKERNAWHDTSPGSVTIYKPIAVMYDPFDLSKMKVYKKIKRSKLKFINYENDDMVIVNKSFLCEDCKGQFTRVDKRKKRCAPCQLERIRVQSVINSRNRRIRIKAARSEKSNSR